MLTVLTVADRFLKYVPDVFITHSTESKVFWAYLLKGIKRSIWWVVLIVRLMQIAERSQKNVTPDREVCTNNVSSVGNKNVDVLDNHVKSDTQLCTISPGVNGIEQNDRRDRKQLVPVCPDQHEKPINNVRGLVGCEKDREVDTLTGNDGCVPIYDIGVSCCDDKFVNSLFSGQKRATLCKNSVYFSSWRKQTDFYFGFLPITEFINPKCTVSNSHSLALLELHELVKASGKPNYLGCRLPVSSELNISVWKQVLQGY